MIVSGVPRDNLMMSSIFHDFSKNNVTLREAACATTCPSVGVRMMACTHSAPLMSSRGHGAPNLDTHYGMRGKDWMRKCKQ